MLSILIPVYNYSIVTLVTELHKQASSNAINFEIICLDDGSKPDIVKANSEMEHLTHFRYLVNATNKGRNATRQLLSEKAQYDWLLFLDADVIPKSTTLIANYLKYVNSDFEAVYGGFAYYKKAPKRPFKLRWEYGRRREEITAIKRNKKRYKAIISANFLIKKSVFNILNKQITGNLYGEDNHFGALLKTHRIAVKHIDNEVYHLGIEPSKKYLHKKEQAALTLLNIYNTANSIDHDNDLLELFETVKRYKCHYLFAFLFKLFNTIMRKNLLGNYPSVNILQLYRISYMCFEDVKKQP